MPARTVVQRGPRDKRSVAFALDWPGWCRRGKGEEAALEALLHYHERYAAVVGAKPHKTLDVVGRVKGNATTEFGAPGVVSDWERPLKKTDLPRLEACWQAFDAVVAKAPPTLAGGRARLRTPGRREGAAAHAVARAARPAARGARRGSRGHVAPVVRRAAHRLARPRPRVGGRGQELSPRG
jgi:hypothetical protein